MSAVTTYLWFTDKGEEAAEFYTTLVPNSQVTSVDRGPDGKVLVATFTLDGQQFAIINGGPHFQASEFASIFVGLDTQEEVDELWARLTADGEEGPCGWCKDRYGVSWQVIPKQLPGLLTHADPAKATAAFEAMQGQKKIDIKAIEDAVAAV